MIVVCKCGQKSRIRDLANAAKMRCAGCKTMLAGEIHRQAERNANIVLHVAAILADGLDKGDTQVAILPIAHVFAHHEVNPS